MHMAKDELPTQVDVDELFDLAAGDPEIVGEILVAFQEEYPRPMADLRRGVAQGDPEMVRERSHALKGICATLGAARARDEAHVLEKMGKGGDLAGASELLGRFEMIMQKVCDELTLVRDELASAKNP